MAKIPHIELLCRGVKAWNARREDEYFVPDLTHIDLRNADLRGADLSAVDFDGSRMINVDLRDANLAHARLNGVNVTRVHFGMANLTSVEFKGADFTRVCFVRAVVDQAVGLDMKVRHGNYTDARLRGCRLEMTHLYNCDLTGADFSASELPSSLLKRVVFDPPQGAALKNAGCRIELANQPRRDEWVDWNAFDVRRCDAEFGAIIHEGRAYWIAEGRWDFFISHASEDKEAVARPLAVALTARAQRVWYDELSIKVGDSLEKVIALGTQASVFGIVVASPRFFGRRWTEAEITALEHKRVFLVLHDMSAEDLCKIRPSLAGRFCLRADIGPDILADALLDAARQPERDP